MFSPKQKLKQINTPDLADALKNLKSDILKTINCVQVGYIQSFNAEDQTATVRLAIKSVKDIQTDGSIIIEEKSLLLQCPVFMLNGGSSYISMPITAGDSCIVLFNDRDIDNWFLDGSVATPNTYRTHDLSDAIALVGLRNMQQVISALDSTSMNIFFSELNNIKINDTENIIATTPLFTITGGLAIGGVVTTTGAATEITIDAPITQTSGNALSAGNGASGSFTTTDNKTVTVEDGIITSIV